MSSPVVCPGCGETIADREELPNDERALLLYCSNCKLGVIVDTEEGAQDGDSNL